MAGDFVIVRLGEQSVKIFLAQMPHDLDTTVPAHCSPIPSYTHNFP